jgi:hypothetical protein
MPKTNRDDTTELIRLALIGLDVQIAKLQEKRTELAALVGQQSVSASAEETTPKRHKMSAAAKAKISAAAKARWAKRKKAEAKAAKPTKTKRAPAKKGKSKTTNPEAESE